MEHHHNNLIEDLEVALNVIATNSNLQLLEKMTENFITMSQNGKNIDAFIVFQVQVFELLGRHAGVVINYLKSDGELPYNGKNKEAFRRLNNLRALSRIFHSNAEKAFASPNSLSTTLFSYNETNPHFITMVLINNNQTAFSSNLDFNSTINLINQLTLNLDEKIHKGVNNIDINYIDQFKEINTKFLGDLEEVIKKENKI